MARQAERERDIRVPVTAFALEDAAPVVMLDRHVVITHITGQGTDPPAIVQLSHVLGCGILLPCFMSSPL